MVIDIFYENHTEIVVSYFPAWEMFFSMHVLANPKHHAARRKWVEEKEMRFPKLVTEIRELKELTDNWNMVIDAEHWSDICQMEIVEMISFFRKMNIYQWNRQIKCQVKEGMSREERDRVLRVIEEYYNTVFRKEELILRPFLLRILREKEEKCRQEGIWKWCSRIHSRLKVEQEEIIYLKNKEYRFA